MNKVLPQDHVGHDTPYNPESLNNLNIAGTSSNENRMPASPNALLHRNIFGSGEYIFLFSPNFTNSKSKIEEQTPLCLLFSF